MAKWKMYLVTLLLVAAAMPVLGSTISTQIREGVYKEEVEGDLDAAMKIYEGIITAHADNQRYAAQATYRLGLCYLKKGQKDKATRQFESVISNYPNAKSTNEKAKSQLTKLKPPVKIPAFLDNPLFLNQIMPVIGQLHFQYRSEAKAAGLAYNCHIYGADETFTTYNGGLNTLENNTSYEWSKDIHLMNASNSNNLFFDEHGNLLDVNVKKRDVKSLGRYTYTWDPPSPIKPGETRTLAWYFGSYKMMKVSENRYTMQMNNHYGSKVMEYFFLVLPKSLHIYKTSRDYTSKKTVAGHDIYIYKRQVPPDTTNKVYLTIGIGGEETAEDNRPAVIKSVPETYANDVSPDLDKLSVTFDQTMKDGCWSWVQWNYEIPKLTDKAYYDSTKTTCYRPSKLKPATAYLIRINAKPYDSFMNADGIKARPFVLVFATKDKDGKPTPIPEEMLNFAKYINAQQVQNIKGVNENAAATLNIFIKALIALDKTEAMKFVMPGSAVANQLRNFNESPDYLKKIRISSVHSDGKIAFALTNGIPSGGKDYLTTFTLVKQRGLWMVNDIDLETVENGKAGLEAFLNKHPNAKPVTYSATVNTGKLQAEDLAGQGWKLWGQRKLVEAEAKFKEAIDKDAGCENAYQGLGWAQLNQGKRHNARDSFKKCIEINAKNSAALNGLGWIAHGQGDIDEAIKWWEKAVKAFEGATASLNGLTQVYMQREEYSKAIVYYKMWLKTEPKNQQAKDGLEKAKTQQQKVGAATTYKEFSDEHIAKVVQKAVATISTCAEGDPKIAEAMKALKPIKPKQVLEELARQMNSTAATKRRSAIYIAWRGGFEDITPAVKKLTELCSHESGLTRGMAALALGEHKVASSFDVLTNMTLNDDNGYAQRCGAYALGRLGNIKALETLKKATEDNDPMVKQNAEAAITMLTELKDK